MLEGLRAGLEEHGWVEGKNLAIELRLAEGRAERLVDLAADLVRQKVDVIVTGSTPAALAAKKMTGSIPIVFVTTGDPVAGGMIDSLARPGGNLTGVTALGQFLSAKRLQLLKEALPGLASVAVLSSPGSIYTEEFRAVRDATARVLGLELPLVEASDPSGIEAAFAAMERMRPSALLILTEPMFMSQRQRIVELASRVRLPAMYPDREFVVDGGLMFYGASLPEMYRHAAVYIDKILKGSAPAELPVEQPTRLELVINLKSARTLGLTLPTALLLRADEVIE